MTETCSLCAGMTAWPPPETSIPLCTRHWNAWLARFMDDPAGPCGAHLITDPAPAGVSAAPTSRDRPIGPAGAPIPTTSEEQCERCGRILDCCRRCGKCEGTQQI